MESVLSNQTLTGRTVLVPPNTLSKLKPELERCDARVITWPEIQIGEPESYAMLDEAIEHLFGYDWLLFQNANAAGFFLRRFHLLGHETSQLDSLRVCAIGEATVAKLEESQVHVDLISGSLASDVVFGAIESYAGGREALGRLNFLIPRASATRDGLRDMLEDAEARVDVVATYRTVSHNNPALTQINALLAGGGIDCIVFTSPATVQKFAELFDANDLSRILAGVAVICIDQSTAKAASDFGVRAL